MGWPFIIACFTIFVLFLGQVGHASDLPPKLVDPSRVVQQPASVLSTPAADERMSASDAPPPAKADTWIVPDIDALPDDEWGKIVRFGRALTVSPDLTLVATRAEELLRLRAALSNYADNVEPVNPNDSHLIQNVAELRAALEAILGVHLTFEGEDRPASGQPMVTSTVQVGSVEGTVTGVQVGGAVTGGRIDSDVTAADVRSGGSVTGVSIGTLGPPAPSASPGKPPPSPAELHDGGLR